MCSKAKGDFVACRLEARACDKPGRGNIAQQLLCAADRDRNPSSSAEGGAGACLAGWEASPLLLTHCFQPPNGKCQIPLHFSLAWYSHALPWCQLTSESILGIVVECSTGCIHTHG